MATEGVTLKDILPLPDNTEAVINEHEGDTSQTLAESPTSSHALATADHDEKGHAQESHDAEVKDLGWGETHEKIADPLVARLPNEELWVLVRRFNKVSHFLLLAPVDELY